RSVRPLLSFLISSASAAVVAVVVCVIVGRHTGTWIPVSQTVLAGYLMIGVVSLLWAFSWALRQVVDRAMWVSNVPPWERGNGWVLRAACAILFRSAVLLGVGLPYLGALGLVYRPRGAGGPGPSQALPGSAAEVVGFAATDGLRLSGWWIPARPPPAAAADPEWGKRTVVLCHGWGGSKGSDLALARDLWANGYNVLAFDFRAHGQSGGQVTSFGDRERHDVLGAVRWVRAAHPEQCGRLYGVGMTSGGAALVAAAADDSPEGRAFDAVALVGTFDAFSSVTDDALSTYAAPPLRWLLRHVGLPLASLHAGSDLTAFAPADLIDRLAPRPVLVIQSRGDGLGTSPAVARVSFESGRRLYQRASQPKLRLWVGELTPKGVWVIRQNAPTDADGKPAPAEGPPADHENVPVDDEALRALRLFFERTRSVV
ncbi:MAG TPA: alpha/beta fold hydrolase, partial [Humisphaera sp.]